MIAMRHWMHCAWRVSSWQMYRCACSKVSFCTAAPVMMAVEDLEALREENYMVQAQNKLIALFLGLHPDPRPIDACQGDAVCAANRCLDKPRKLAKRKRPPRRATTSRLAMLRDGSPSCLCEIRSVATRQSRGRSAGHELLLAQRPSTRSKNMHDGIAFP